MNNLLALTLLWSGCSNTALCGPGTRPVDGVCLAADGDSDSDADIDSDADADSDGDSDADSDSDSDADADADAGAPVPCGWGTEDIDCDGEVDPECAYPAQEEIQYDDPEGFSPRIDIVLSDGGKCTDAGVQYVTLYWLGWWGDRGGAACGNNPGLRDVYHDFHPTGCYPLVIVGTDDFGNAMMSAGLLVHVGKGQPEYNQATLWPCSAARPCPF